MPDFEVMPIGTRNAMKETAMLLRQYEAHHRVEAAKLRAPGDVQPSRIPAAEARDEKAERNRVAAERLEVLLGEPDPRTIPHSIPAASGPALGDANENGQLYTTMGWRSAGVVWVAASQLAAAVAAGWRDTGGTDQFQQQLLHKVER